MARTIHAIFIDPPIAVARLGGSTAPQDAYRWVESVNPRSDGNTVIDPWWTLDVLGDGSVEPRLPTSVRLRDGGLIRPVAPFFEVWALVGSPQSPASRWTEVPLTPDLLREAGVDESAITIEVDAKNRKAARRMVNPDLVFGTYPAVSVRGDDHGVHALAGGSPPDAITPMIPRGRQIPLGSFQIMRSRKQPTGGKAPWEDVVNVETIRFRFTPARGRFYGPPEAARQTAEHEAAVAPGDAFLDPEAGWLGGVTRPTLQPADTYDLLRPPAPNSEGASLGVVDDTCEARATVRLTLPGRKTRVLEASASIFAGPPDFAPDRRPFLSLADELNDRGGDGARRNAALGKAEQELWVGDLFERIFETVSLFNLDHFQRDLSILLRGDRLRRQPIAGDQVKIPRDHAMTRMDRLRNPDLQVEGRSQGVPLPLHEHARTRHRLLQDVEGLREFISEHPGRLEELIRQPFEVQQGEDAGPTTTMRMPPFMRQSNAFPLTLSVWQYELLMSWVRSVEAAKALKPAAKAPRLSPEAAERRRVVLARLDAQENPNS